MPVAFKERLCQSGASHPVGHGTGITSERKFTDKVKPWSVYPNGQDCTRIPAVFHSDALFQKLTLPFRGFLMCRFMNYGRIVTTPRAIASPLIQMIADSAFVWKAKTTRFQLAWERAHEPGQVKNIEAC
jgi:hypothetical protein